MPDLPWAHKSMFQMTLLGSALGSLIVNVINYEASTVEEATFVNDGVAQTSGSALASDWQTNMLSTWLACHPTEYKLNTIKVQVVERPGLFRHKLTPTEITLTTGNSGSAGATTESLTNSAVVKWRTPQAGKSTRGRVYIGPIGEGWIADGRLNSTGLTPLNAWAAAQLTRYTGAGASAVRWHMAIYSRPYNMGEYQYASRKTGTLAVVTPPDYAGNSTFVTAQAVDGIVRVQRRREVGVGA
jgi:hypothetical protein